MDVSARIIESLLTKPIPLDEATASPGLPRDPGFYAWWTEPGSIPGVPRSPRPGVEEVDLFYVGISPSRETSRQSIRKRVIGNHIRGNTGGSTFRLTLASLLFEQRGWAPVMRGRPLLTTADNKELTDWQRQNLRLTWAVQARPWEVERAVIEALAPPLNLAHNRSHPFAATLTRARRRFHEAARPA